MVDKSRRAGRLSRARGAAALLLAALLVLPGPAAAVFIKDELDVIDPEPLFDSEYFLDLRSFSYPADWLDRWGRSRRGYRINSASLDRTDLFIEQEVRLAQKANDWLAFDYALVQRGDKDVVDLHQWISLEFGPWSGASFAVFGEPTFDKEDADIGFLARYSPGERWGVWGSANAVDFNFNQRGKSNERYDRKPVTFELGAGFSPGAGRLGARLELDMPLIRSIPDSNRVYNYRRTTLRLDWSGPGAGDGWDLNGGYAYELKREANSFSPDPAGRSQDFNRSVHVLRGSGARALNSRDRVELGAEFMTRWARAEFRNSPSAGSRHRRWEALPYARWRRQVRPWGVAEAAVFLGFGERRRLGDVSSAFNSAEAIVEAKLGTGFDFLYGDDGRIGLYGTFDLDDADKHVWDGGNIRAMFLF